MRTQERPTWLRRLAEIGGIICRAALAVAAKRFFQRLCEVFDPS